MPRPSRIVEAKEKLRAHHAEHGLMPSLSALAELLGLRGASSVQELVADLVQSGFLAREGRAGRLVPGASFVRKSQREVTVPPELLAALPKDVELKVVRVPDDSLKAEGLLAGDCLVVAPADRTDLSATLLLAKAGGIAVTSERWRGWSVGGVVVAQFRSYALDSIGSRS